MSESEFRECKFILNEMCFYGYNEFVKDAYAIKRLYVKLKSPIFYRWYVYAQPLSNERKKAIWEFLNSNITFEKLTKI